MVDANQGIGIPGKASSSVIVWMILLGGYATLRGITALSQWSAYSIWTQLYYGVSIGAGTSVAVLGLVQIGLRTKARLLGIAEVGVLLLLTTNQFAGLLWNTILCYTPG